MIIWQYNEHPLLTLLLCSILAVVLVYLWRLLRRRHTAKLTVLLFSSRLLLLTMLFLAFCDPIRLTVGIPDDPLRIALVSDLSSSMDIADKANTMRRQRAEAVCKELLDTYQDSARFAQLYFTDSLSESPQKLMGNDPELVRNTDLGGALLAMCDDKQISDSELVIMLTDGGDQIIENTILPGKPVYIAAIGAEGWDMPDAAIEKVDFPPAIDVKTQATITVDTAFSGFASITADIGRPILVLEESVDNFRTELGRVELDPALSVSRHEFTVQPTESPGIRKFRLSLKTAASELTLLNNTRDFALEVRDKQISVLYYAHEIGWEFRTVRASLADESSIRLSAVFRLAQGQSSSQFVVQTEDTATRELLKDGFPQDAAVLGQFQCIIIDSVAAESWLPEQIQALKQYVSQGGAVVFMGGPVAYIAGGYQRSELADLIPFSLDNVGESFVIGQFPVAVPATAAGNPVVSEIAGYLSNNPAAMIESVNIPGTLKPAAVELLSASVGQNSVPLLVISRFGNGQVMAVNSNTFWKWTRQGETMAGLFATLWRQGLKSLTDIDDQGRIVTVKWLQDTFLPGQQAQAIITVSANYPPGMIHLEPAISRQGQSVDCKLEPADDTGRVFNLSFLLAGKGDYLVSLNTILPGVGNEQQTIEKYAKVISVGSNVNEGSRPAVNYVFLNDLATRSGGVCYREGQIDMLKTMLNDRVSKRTIKKQEHLVNDNNYFLYIFILAITAEWYIRRRLNQI